MTLSTTNYLQRFAEIMAVAAFLKRIRQFRNFVSLDRYLRFKLTLLHKQALLARKSGSY
jgi:hypothetical protein